MRLLSCLHPKVVVNPYTNEKVIARCGKCEACLNARAANWVQRLDIEARCHKYVYFATFQYDEQHVPQMVRLEGDDALESPCYIDSETGNYISLMDDSIKTKLKKDFDYCYETKVLNVHNRSDFPKFIKLLRYHAQQLCKNEPTYSGIRYYACAEYGPTTYRPHFHCIFFIDSPLLSKNFEVLLRRSWKYGCVFDPHIVHGSCSNYVASYVNCSSILPAIYSHKEIRQRNYFSKYPAIGTLDYGIKEVQEIFNSAACEQRIFDASSNKFRDVPLWRVFQSRLFPRVQRFDCISHSDRVALYRLSEIPAISMQSAVDAARWLEICYVNRLEDKSFISDYLRLITSIPYKLLHGSKAPTTGRYCFDSLVRFVRTIKRVAVQSSQFAVTIEFYVSQIEKFYDNRQKSELSNYFQLQDEYFKSNPISDYIAMNYDFVKRVNGKHICDLSDSDRFYLDYYGIIDDSDDIVHLSLEQTFEFQDLLKTHKKIYWDNSKSKSRNDYLFSKSSQFKNIINYQSSF